MSNRVIKFRAWSKEKKAFIAGFNMVNFHSYFNKGVEPHIFRYSTEWKLSEIELLQFTGLFDKNGKEIYEGDIIQNVADDGRRLSIFEISWQQSSCGFVKEREDGHTFTLEISKYCEVIGNIYENPELLTSEQTKEQ